MPLPLDPNPQFEQYAHPERLVSASWLSARLGSPGLRVVESDEDALLYDIGHIPGAVRIDWAKDLNDKTIRDFIDADAFAKLMDEKGIAPDDTVVVYGDKSNWWAAFTLWIFELFGHKDVRILDGGRDAWMAEERDTSYAVPDYPASNYEVSEHNEAPSRIFVDEIRQRREELTLLDVRSEEEFAGTTTKEYPQSNVSRHGHIPGARNISWEHSTHANGRFRDFEELQQTFADFQKEEDIVVYCQVGERAAHSWFVLKYLLGYPTVRNYDGGWVEWGNMVRMPIATEPSA
ncbi:sulfurtransferase [Corynebacterium pelargi]|uniref:Thiosulfate sulfurtransferase SseA n=1 Tax=Corynebacterium pelargi TaxID=1471400 RepID=A0A410WAF7_9CORY|nr:sulfurtransferase [Corynebacterium pelargi]QAU52963.1 Putative thiosulfate sulfurtransferase SseA [Corynebacterium pelargi]GGG75714.1 thiosulfate sulfurtransferase [Corynebacterium pelargi]